MPRKIEPGETFQFSFSKDWLKELIIQQELTHKQIFMESFSDIFMEKALVDELAEKAYEEYCSKKKKSESYKIVICTYDSTNQDHDHTLYYNIAHDLVWLDSRLFRFEVFMYNLKKSRAAGEEKLQKRIEQQEDQTGAKSES